MFEVKTPHVGDTVVFHGNKAGTVSASGGEGPLPVISDVPGEIGKFYWLTPDEMTNPFYEEPTTDATPEPEAQTPEQLHAERVNNRIADELHGIKNPTAFELAAARELAEAQVAFTYLVDGADDDALDEAVSAAERKMQAAKRKAGRRVRITHTNAWGRKTYTR